MPLGWNAYPRSILPDNHWEALYQAVVILTDEVMSDLISCSQGDGPKSWFIEFHLPPKYLPRYDEGFLRKFLACLMSVGLKMRLPGFHPLGCVAEEIALRAVRLEAESILQDNGDSFDYSDWEEVVYEDVDYEHLYELALDGIEDSGIGTMLGMGNLRYEEWFLPFNTPRNMHPYADCGDEREMLNRERDNYLPEHEAEE